MSALYTWVYVLCNSVSLDFHSNILQQQLTEVYSTTKIPHQTVCNIFLMSILKW